MRYYHYIVAIVLACGASGAYWLLQRSATADGMPDSDARINEVQEVAAWIDDVSQARPVEPEENTTVPERERLKTLGLTEQEIAERKRLQALREAADRRFNTTVETDNLEAEQVPVAVRKLFKTMTLEPVLPIDGQEGYIDGMRIANITDTNPLAKAGFHTGDHLVSFNGLPLRDPAEIAYLFADLTGQFEVCAERDGNLRCRIVSLVGG